MVISRQQAITLMLPRYFTGVACKRGHLVERYTSNSACISCAHPSFGRRPGRPAKENYATLADIAKLP